MKGKLIFVIELLLCLSLLLAACGRQQGPPPQDAEPDPSGQGDTITEPYQYPILPGTEEWGELKSLDEMIEACHVPEEILENITTEALFQTVLDYPLLVNFVVYASPGDLKTGRRLGFEAILGYCNGLQELVERPDVEEVVQAFVDTKECQEGRYLYREFSTALLEYLQEDS